MQTDPIPESFVDGLAFELRFRGVPVLRSALRRWLADAGPLVADDPSVGRWARAYLEVHLHMPAFAEGPD
jgi:hypothetical protein